jgi:hypothetical protein
LGWASSPPAEQAGSMERRPSEQERTLEERHGCPCGSVSQERRRAREGKLRARRSGHPEIRSLRARPIRMMREA